MKICLDAGHAGNYNRSPVVPSYWESHGMWKLTNLQKKYLEEFGFEVVLTRPTLEKDLDVVARGRVAKGCDFFESLHSNAAGQESIDYPVAITLLDRADKTIDEKSHDLGYKLIKKVEEVMGTKQKGRTYTRKASTDRDRDGLKNDNYYGVLHGAFMVGVPGIITEHSFHTNKAMTEWLLVDANLDKLARAKAQVYAEHFGVQPQPIGNELPFIAKIVDKDIYNEPNLSATRIGHIDNGSFTIIEKSGIFGRLKSGAGWIQLEDAPLPFTEYTVRVSIRALNIRTEPSVESAPRGTMNPGIYTIVDEQDGPLDSKGTIGKWGKLKSGAGWIALKYTERM